ncbi:MAG TPA: Gfo/Idh/MocA family oxidoreductase [Bryobacteraceae bacterium]|nr:Gfo/Idh/MocA family oxidoreductase [Bryobacteraceae bacterium]
MYEKNSITRRDALKAAGAAGAVAVAADRSGPSVRPIRAAGNQVRYAVIGTGDRGSFLLNRLKEIDNGRCVALCDIYPPNLNRALQSMNGQPRAYTDYREVLAAKDIDAVVIATPLFRHFEVARDSLEAGKHVFCEKTLVFKPREVHALRATAAAHPRQIFQTGLQRRYSPFYKAAKAMIDKGLIGEVTHIRAQWHRNGSGRRPVSDPKLDRQINWRFYREYSGGLTAELASHQMDVADWFFGSQFDFVSGVGGIDHWKDGRDTYDNIMLHFSYPGGRKLMYSSISTNAHLPIFGGTRPQFGEEIMGTGGTIQITIGDAANPAVGPAIAMWYREPNAPKVQAAGKAAENWVAGATSAASGVVSRPLPLLLPGDTVTERDSFLQREMKFARRWLYSRGVMLPEEERNPVTLSLEDFFRCVREGRKPAADLEVGLGDSCGVILANLAMDEGRRVYYREIENMGRA